MFPRVIVIFFALAATPALASELLYGIPFDGWADASPGSWVRFSDGAYENRYTLEGINAFAYDVRYETSAKSAPRVVRKRRLFSDWVAQSHAFSSEPLALPNETLTIDGKPLTCSVIQYSQNQSTLTLWRNDTVPGTIVKVAEKIVRGDIHAPRRNTEMWTEDDAAEEEYSGIVSSLADPLTIAGKNVSCAVLTCTETITTRGGHTQQQLKYWLSNEVPGKLARSIITFAPGQSHDNRVVEFNLAQVQKAPAKAEISLSTLMREFPPPEWPHYQVRKPIWRGLVVHGEYAFAYIEIPNLESHDLELPYASLSYEDKDHQFHRKLDQDLFIYPAVGFDENASDPRQQKTQRFTRNSIKIPPRTSVGVVLVCKKDELSLYGQNALIMFGGLEKPVLWPLEKASTNPR